MVDGDANRTRLLLLDARLLELSEGEAAPLAQLVVVLVGGRVDDRAEEAGGRARGDGGSLRLTSRTPPVLAHRLLEPRLHTVLP